MAKKTQEKKEKVKFGIMKIKVEVQGVKVLAQEKKGNQVKGVRSAHQQDG